MTELGTSKTLSMLQVNNPMVNPKLHLLHDYFSRNWNMTQKSTAYVGLPGYPNQTPSVRNSDKLNFIFI